MNINPISLINHFRISDINNNCATKQVSFGNLALKEDVFSRQTPRDNIELDKVLSNREVLIASIRPENYLGAGANVKAFLIDSDSDEKFIIKIPHTFDVDSLKDIKFKKIPYETSGYNYGEPVAISNKNVFVAKFIPGKTHSVPDIIDIFYRMILEGKAPTHEEAQMDLASLKKVAKFPIESYINLAKQIKKLNGTGKCVDYINPNNLLIDEKNKQINVIDIWRAGKWNNNSKSGYINMIMLLCNGWGQQNFINALDTNEQKEYKKATREIINKCKIAAHIEKLPANAKSVFDVANYINGNAAILAPGKNIDLLECLNWFFDTYKLN